MLNSIPEVFNHEAVLSRLTIGNAAVLSSNQCLVNVLFKLYLFLLVYVDEDLRKAKEEGARTTSRGNHLLHAPPHNMVPKRQNKNLQQLSPLINNYFLVSIMQRTEELVVPPERKKMMQTTKRQDNEKPADYLIEDQ